MFLAKRDPVSDGEAIDHLMNSYLYLVVTSLFSFLASLYSKIQMRSMKITKFELIQFMEEIEGVWRFIVPSDLINV